MIYDIEDIYKKIKDLMRSDKAYTPAGIAEYLGKKDRQSYYDIFKKDIGIIELQQIAEYFGKNISYFLSEYEAPSTNNFKNFSKENELYDKLLSYKDKEIIDKDKEIKDLKKELLQLKREMEIQGDQIDMLAKRNKELTSPIPVELKHYSKPSKLKKD